MWSLERQRQAARARGCDCVTGSRQALGLRRPTPAIPVARGTPRPRQSDATGDLGTPHRSAPPTTTEPVRVSEATLLMTALVSLKCPGGSRPSGAVSQSRRAAARTDTPDTTVLTKLTTEPSARCVL
eukprot:CAMPEP_0185198022 /NCGR_PEP_ID=MMETSP1140-20130426/41832_1 /TAXON_ID=298111 /ORGANISM="Pavlova sp., Strain CCMP459" /LENGTH=126 /DNA_ID=CAMNT_0027765189 /DNA_START=123 /DNA_END=501 /DNA_ORIENTATION=-